MNLLIMYEGDQHLEVKYEGKKDIANKKNKAQAYGWTDDLFTKVRFIDAHRQLTAAALNVYRWFVEG